MLDKVIKAKSVHLPITPQETRWGLWVSRVGCGGRGPGKYYGMGDGGRILDEFAVVYITRGRGVFYAHPGRGKDIHAGDLMLLFPGVWHCYESDIKTGWNEYWALFDGAWPQSIMEQEVISPAHPVLHAGLDGSLHQLFVRMIDMAGARATGWQMEISALMMQVLARALALSRSRLEQKHKYRAALQEAMLYLQEHLEESVNLEKLAGSLHISYPHFRRLFRQLIGVSPYQYHLQLRIMRAKEMLEVGDMSVKEVAAAMGFDDPYYFARIFKQKAGVPPSQWKGM